MSYEEMTSEEMLKQANEDRKKAFAKLVFERMSQSLDVTYTLMEKLAFDTAIRLPSVMPDTVWSFRRVKENGLHFVTHFRNKGSLRRHHHSDCYELFVSEKGRFHILTDDRDFVAEEGESITFQKSESHKVTCLDDEGLAQVIFVKRLNEA